MYEIYFHFEDTESLSFEEDELKHWIYKTIQEEGGQLVSLNYVITSDEYLLSINQQYLSHDYYTDIITFDNSESESDIEGDLFISIDRIKENASNSSGDFNTELHRVMIHGVLHLLGYGDKTQEEKKLMRSKEDAYLSLLKK